MMHRLFVTLVALQSVWTVAAKTFSISSYYLGDRCSGTPYAVYTTEDGNCTAQECASNTGNSSNADMVNVECASDYLSVVRSKFGASPYIIQTLFSDEDCMDAVGTFGYPASGTCVGSYNITSYYYIIADLDRNGSGSVQTFLERSCLSGTLQSTFTVDQATLSSHSCDANWLRWYSSNDKETSSSSGAASTDATDASGSGIGTIGVIAITLAGAVVLTVIVAALVLRKHRALRKSNQLKEDLLASSLPSTGEMILGQSGLWEDDVITTKRIPREKVIVQDLISQGSFGEVYHGVYNERTVAVKMLRSSLREKLKHVNEFLAEAKINATIEHPSIVSFVGVAWDSLSDLCVVLEFMDGGELRSLLSRYKETDHPVGFDAQKVRVALQVCHALTYLHSLTPSVMHRDLKSRNILLSSSMDAKLSDFGISRERLDRTMTAGVGTSLWMAPEVMLGERYDDKVDMFSFGVVLSELDSHTLPYEHIRKTELDSNGREMTDAILLQKVALGTVSVDFSPSNLPAIVELGRACVAIDPTERPSAAEALYKLQVILSSRRLRK